MAARVPVRVVRRVRTQKGPVTMPAKKKVVRVKPVRGWALLSPSGQIYVDTTSSLRRGAERLRFSDERVVRVEIRPAPATPKAGRGRGRK